MILPRHAAGEPIHDVAVVGGGFFGCQVALDLRERGGSVVLLEREPELLRRASLVNQARVHNGYHYPRSLLTAMRSRANFQRFCEAYPDCVSGGVEHVYAVGRLFTKTSAAQFRTFCARLGLSLSPAPRSVRRLFTPTLIDEAFLVREAVFDATRLRARLLEDLRQRGVVVRLGAAVRSVGAGAGGVLELALEAGDAAPLRARRVVSCAYAGTNALLAASGLPLLGLKHELTELALVEPPEELEGRGVTVMDGPFFSLLPFPPRTPLATVSHVRYTPHRFWEEGPGRPALDPDAVLSAERESRFEHMRMDIRRYLPAADRCRYVESLWEIKTVLPRSEVDDSRPILFRRDHGLANFDCVFGGKIDNVYDVLDEMHAPARKAAS